jgi:hypothetical protein
LRRSDYWIALLVLLWLGTLAVRPLAGLMPVTGVWEGGYPSGAVINALALEPGQLLAGTGRGLYISGDRGESWEAVPELDGCDVTAVFPADARTIAVGCDRLWTRTDGRWTGAPLEVGGDVHQLLLSGGSLLVASDEGLFSMGSPGQMELRLLWPPPGEAPAAVNAVRAMGASLLLGTDDGLVQIEPESLRQQEMGLAGKRVLGVDVGGDWIQAALGGPEGGLARARAGSGEWEKGAVPSEYAQVVLVDPRDASKVYAGLWGLADEFSISGVVVSEDAGATWQPLKSRLLNSFVPAMALDAEGGVLYAGTNGGGTFRYVMPSLLDRAVQESRPVLDTLEPLLLGVIALALLLRRRPRRS